MERKSQKAVQRIIREIHAELDGITGDNYPPSVKKVKKLVAELKNTFYAADKANRKKQNTLAKNLQQCIKERTEIRESLHELRSLQAMVREIRFANNPEEILSALQDLAGKIIQVEESNIFLFDQKSGTISSIVESSDQKLKQKIAGFLEEGIIDWIFEENRAVVVEDFETIGGENQKEKERNVVFIPWILHGDERGIFALYTSKPKDEFTHQDLDLLKLLTDQGTVALENYRIKQRLQEIEQAR